MQFSNDTNLRYQEVSGAAIPFQHSTSRAAGEHSVSSSREVSESNDIRLASDDRDRLLELLHRTTLLDLRDEPGPMLAHLLRWIFSLESVAVYDADLQRIDQSGRPFDDVENLLPGICIFAAHSDDPETGLIRRALILRDLTIGALLLRGEMSAPVADAVAALVATTFDRFHAIARESRSASERRIEQLRATVLDSLAHSYKTPLTAIRAASSGLSEMGGLSSAQAELVSLIEEQADQLSHLTTRLLKTARLDADDIIPRMENLALLPWIDDLLAATNAQQGTVRIRLRVSGEVKSLRCDRGLLSALLTQYLDNALRYSAPKTPITLCIIGSEEEVEFSVHNTGQPIPIEECERIFERYSRCRETAQDMPETIPGTGIGLSIARRAAEAHGGRVWVQSDASSGTTFLASIPLQRDFTA